MKLVTRMRSGMLWMRAYSLCSARRYEESLTVLKSAPEVMRSATHWRLLEVYDLGLLERDVECLQSATALIKDLEPPETLEINQRYLLEFARWCAQVSFRRLFPTTDVPIAFRLDVDAIPWKEVAPIWRRRFPLPSAST